MTRGAAALARAAAESSGIFTPEKIRNVGRSLLIGMRSLRSHACTWRALARRQGSAGYKDVPGKVSSTYSEIADDSDNEKPSCTNVGTRCVIDVEANVGS